MRRALGRKLLPRQDVCSFCAFRYAFQLQGPARPLITPRRSYQSSATSRRPGTAAALRVDEEDDTSFSHRGVLLGWRCQCKHVNKPRRSECTVCTTPRPPKPSLVYEGDKSLSPPSPPQPQPPPPTSHPTPQNEPAPRSDARIPPRPPVSSARHSPAASSRYLSGDILEQLGRATDREARPFTDRIPNTKGGGRGEDVRQSDAASPGWRYKGAPSPEPRIKYQMSSQMSSESQYPPPRDQAYSRGRHFNDSVSADAPGNTGSYSLQLGNRDHSFPPEPRARSAVRNLQNQPVRNLEPDGQFRMGGVTERSGATRPSFPPEKSQQTESSRPSAPSVLYTPMSGAPRQRESRDRGVRDQDRSFPQRSQNDDRFRQRDRSMYQDRRVPQRGTDDSSSNAGRPGARYGSRTVSEPETEEVQRTDFSGELEMDGVGLNGMDDQGFELPSRKKAMERDASRRSRVYEVAEEDAEADEPMRAFRNSAVRGPETRERRSRKPRTFDEDDEDDYTPRALRASKKSRKQSAWNSGNQYEAFGDNGPNSPNQKNKRNAANSRNKVKPADRPEVALPEFISVEKLAQALKVKLDPFIAQLEAEGFEGARYDHILDSSTSAMFADLYGFEPVISTAEDGKDLVARPAPEDPSVLPPRPPIVTIMGHVDHGKTTILDYFRKSSVVESEHGGITQHIGAFSVIMPGSERNITFLDTPGHAAFLDMRRRGANVTDIVVLVVAADDGVMPQTIEAIKHAREAGVQIIVAINKIDKEDADVERVKQVLSQHDIVVESYGGEYQSIPVSGKTGQGMAELEEAITLLADVADFRAEIDGPVEGWIIESKVTTAGRVATVLVRRGTLKPGDSIVAGNTWARVRTLRNDAGQYIEEAPPGTPVQVDGWRGADPDAGMEVLQADDEHRAKEVVDLRIEKTEAMQATTEVAALNLARSEEAEARAKVVEWEKEQGYYSMGYKRRPKDNEGWVEKAAGGPQRVHFVIKADVAGSCEALVQAVSAIGNHDIVANIIHSGVGELRESDIKMLAATGELGYALSFNQPVENSIRRLSEVAGLEILDHNIIYKVTDDVTEKLSDALPPLISHRVLGEAEVGQIFDISVKKKVMKIAGCKVTNGTISRAQSVRVQRGGEVVYTGTLNSLKNVKKDVTEMRKGTECGMAFENWDDFQEGDQIQCFEEIKEKRTL